MFLSLDDLVMVLAAFLFVSPYIIIPMAQEKPWMQNWNLKSLGLFVFCLIVVGYSIYLISISGSVR